MNMLILHKFFQLVADFLKMWHEIMNDRVKLSLQRGKPIDADALLTHFLNISVFKARQFQISRHETSGRRNDENFSSDRNARD